MSEAVVAAPGTILGQPRGLWLLFFVEMWERFSFYGMRALLIFYLTQHFLFGDAAASAIYASYGSLVYLMPLLGGLIADRYLGFRKAVGFGAVLLCIGHFGMAIEGDAARVTADGVAARSRFVADLLRVAGLHHHRRRIPQAEHFEHGRPAVREGRSAPRRRFHLLLYGHQPWRDAGIVDRRLPRTDVRLGLRFRPRRHRHARRSDHVPARAASAR